MKNIVTISNVLILLIGFSFNSKAQYGVGTGGGFGIGCINIPVPLPITLLSFSGECSRENYTLQWSTASELNNDFFTIERSKDAVNFESVGVIYGAGTTNQTNHYTFEDKQILFEVTYYRLKQTDYDGSSTYSDVIVVGCDNLDMYLVYPNPAKDIVYITVDDSNEITDVQLVDAKGSVIYSSQFKIKTSINTSSLSEGIYFLSLVNTKKKETIKVLKTH
jgi:hypothetical protein